MRIFVRQQLPQTPRPPRAPQTPVAPAAQAPADLAQLQAHLNDLRVTQASLKAQHEGLRSQLDEMLQTNPARPGVQQQWADVGVQLANVDGEIAGVQARISQREGRPIGTPRVVVNPGRRGPDPDLFVAGGFALTMALVLPLSISWAIRLLRRNPPAPPPRADDARFDRLEQAVDAIAIEVERISEGQRFITKIMSDRAPGARPASAPVAEGVLALGAGAAEPIRMAEKQAVRSEKPTSR